MASMGSFPAGVDTSILLHSSNHGRPVIPILGHRPRKHLEVGVFSDGNYSNGFPRTSTLHHLVSKRSLQKRVKATSDGGGVDENNDEKEDALQVTIEKSKKVLAMQRDLLQQISERKKLVSSIKDSIISEESQPSDVENGTSSTPDATVTDAKEDWKDIPASDAGFRQQLEASSSLNVSSKNVPLKSNNGLAQREPSLETKSFKELPKTVEPISGSKTSTETNSEQKLRKTVNPILGSKNSTEKDSEQKLKDAYTKTVVLSDIPSSRKSEGADDVKEFFAWDTNSEAQESGKEDVKSPPLAGPNVMNVILAASECTPWIKTGGLGDVAGALPKALARRGHRVMVIVPRYGDYAPAQDVGVRKRYKVDGQDFEVNYFHAYIDGVDFVFIDSPAFRHLGNNIYGGNREDVLKRMVLFCKAAVEVPWHVPCGGICYGDGNLVFIANDWHTALLPVYLKAYYRDNGLMQYTRSVLVIHNIAHQGRGPVEDFSKTDLPPHYIDLFKLYDPVGGEHFNIFAAGLKTADRIVTVSHGYAWELKTSEGGWGLHGIINENDWKFCGIVNGIDTNEWNPESDVYLQSDGYSNYSIETLKPGKAQCKSALQKELGLPVREGVPLIGFIGRLDHQKGVDLIAEAVPWMMGQDVQLVMLGTGRPDLEKLLRQFEGQYNDRVRGWVGFSVKTAHRITAAADILLMPSRFEPCGLNQLYAMRYGTIPVVHAVGGLRDTVQPFNPFEETGLGWTFAKAEANELINALGNCLLTYRQYKESWAGLQRRGMMQDLSWDNAAVHYEEVLVTAKYQW